MIGVLNLSISNLNSVLNAFDHLAIPHSIVENVEQLERVSHIILPGVGTFASGMQAIEQRGFLAALKYQVIERKRPFLGICLGMQLLFNKSEESPGISGLGLIDGTVRRLPQSDDYKIPRIGWCETVFCKEFLTNHTDSAADYYYLHSYQAEVNDSAIVAARSGKDLNIVSAIQVDNIHGVQFHPEKSHTAGLQILKAFARYTP